MCSDTRRFSVANFLKMCNMWLLYCGVLVLLCTLSVNCFNVETVNYAQMRGDAGSSFGFSVALHKETGESW